MALKQKLAELVVDITAKLAPLKGQLAKANAMLKRGFATMVRMARRAAIGIGVALVAAFAWATRAAMKQQKAEIALTKALERTGDATKKNIDRLKKYAAKIQETTLQGDEETIMLMAQLKTLGVHTDKLEEGARAYIAFQHMAMRGNTALKAAAALMKGDTSLLNSYSTEMRAATTQTEKLAIAQEMVNRGFAAEEAAAEGATGAIAQLRMTIGDVAEYITEQFLPNIENAADWLKRWIGDNRELIKIKTKDWFEKVSKALGFVADGVLYIVKRWKMFAGLGISIAIGKIIVAIAALVTALATLAAIFGTVAVGFGALIGLAWGLLGALVGGIVGAIRLEYRTLKRQAENALAATKKEIQSYKDKHRLMRTAANALRLSNKKELKDIESLTAARKKLRIEMKKLREYPTIAGYKSVFAAVNAMTDAIKTAIEKGKLPPEKETKDVLPKLSEEEKEAAKEAAYKKLKALAAYYKKVGGYEDKLIAVNKTLRLKEAAEITKVIGGDVLEIFNELEAAAERVRLAALPKAEPIEIARAGLVGIGEAWGQIATGTQRTQEEQLKVQRESRDFLRTISERGEKSEGMQNMTTPRH